MLSIGEFSRICFVTKKTLRHYDEIGLLRPGYTAENGYRYYTVGQLRTMLLISRLKGYGFSLPEIAAVLACPSEDYLAERLEEKRLAMQARAEETRQLLGQLQQDVEKLKRREDILDKGIVVKTVERAPQKLFGVRKRIDVKDFGTLFDELFKGIGQRQLQPAGPPMAFYHEEAFNPADSDIEVAVPVQGDGEGVRQYAGGLHCFTTLVGPYSSESFTAAYAGIMRWIDEQGYRLTGAPFDVYVRGGDGSPPEDNVTEIYFPVEKMA